MSKIKFGNFITYTGKYLSTAMSKAQSGNLVFARIINSPVEGADKAEVTLTNIIVDGVLRDSYVVNNVGKDGYYIFGGKADGHLVTFDDFKALKEEVAKLDAKVGDLSIGEGESKVTYDNVPAYVAAYVDSRLKALEAYKVKDVKVGDTSIVDENGVVTLGDAAQKNVATAIVKDSTDLATAGQVFDAIDAITEVVVAGGTGIAVGSTTADGTTTYTVSVDNTIATTSYVDEKISKLGDVVNFLGVVDEKPTSSVVIVNGVEIKAQNGDLVFTSTGEEYIYTGEWEEIGKVDIDEAVTSAKGSTYVSVTGNGDGDEKTGNITISVVTSDIEEGATGLATAADVYAAVEAAKDAATVTGASGYLKVENKNVVVDADQVQLGATSTDTKLATKGYVDDQIAEVSLEAAKHSSVKSATETYIGVTGVTVENGSVEYQVSLEDAALAAKNHTIEAIEIDGKAATGATTVQGALQDLFEGQFTASESLVDLNDRLDNHINSTEAHAAKDITYAGATNSTATNVEDALDELYSQLATVDGAAVKSVTGDAYVGATTVDGAVTLTTDIADAVNTSDIEGYTPAEATGLTTDAWVKDYITSILAWETLED